MSCTLWGVIRGLEEALRNSEAATSPVVVWLHGPAGAGRSWNLEQLARAALAQPGARVDRVRCDALLDSALAQLLRERLGLPRQLPRAGLKAALEGRLPGAPASTVEFFATLLGAVDPSFTIARLDPAAQKEGAFAELARWLAAQAAQAAHGGPLPQWVWLLDDVHASDADTAAFVDLLLQLPEALPALVVISSCDEEWSPRSPWFSRVEQWRARQQLIDLPVSALPAEALSGLLKDRGATDEEAQLLAARANGNPALAVGLWEHREALAACVSPTLLDVARQEVEALSPAAVAAALRAAHGPARISLEAIAAAWPGSAAELRAGLAQLTQAQVLQSGVDPAWPGGVWTFRTERHRRALREGQGAQLATPEDRARWTFAYAEWALAVLRARSEEWDVLAPLVAPALLDGNPSNDEGFAWTELWAHWLLRHQRPKEALPHLERAAANASGVRRWVLARRLGEELAFGGELEKALAALRVPAGAGLSGGMSPVVAQVRKCAALEPLDCWEELSLDEAQIAVALAQAEVLSQLARTDETRRAYELAGERLERAKGNFTPALWVRWASTWSWFLAEVLGSSAQAMRVCERARQYIERPGAKRDEHVAALIRAEQIAASRHGAYERARDLADAQIRLARTLRDVREESVAWNARAIMHFSVAELPLARAGFERALSLARSIGFRRREAISLHNLALVLCEQGETERARRAELEYLTVSAAIANHLAKAYGPAVLAAVAIAAGDEREADPQLALARRAAEANGWPMLLAWVRALTARARLARYLRGADSLLLKQARLELLGCLDICEERSTAWTEELDPGEQYALLAAVELLAGDPEAARVAVARGRERVPHQSVVSHRHLEIAGELVRGHTGEASIAWLEEHHCLRAAKLWLALSTALAPVLV